MPTFRKSTRRPSVGEAAKIRITFDLYDKDKDGGLNKAEFLSMLTQLGIKLTENDAMELFKEMDLDGSGKIEVGEFLDSYYTVLDLAEQEECRVIQELSATSTFTRAEIEAMHANFKRISKTHHDDGLIDKTEFTAMMLNGNVASWNAFLLDGLFRMFDADKSGGITFEEFVKCLSLYNNKAKQAGDDKDRLLYSIYDVDGDKLLSVQDVSCVLADCFKSNNLFFEQSYTDELVLATFKAAGLGPNDKMTFEQYKLALYGPGGPPK
eukprot:TRINITY_DN1430_c0_g1_i1.p1 TRINITY_DN1430_c0_g1~~TRINITY_DN1430_c0_g1_i1.p1  ORF type:complete len:266 (+),score=126.74 TRINITY_DN1430_c0_g1_i1:123-920(+)